MRSILAWIGLVLMIASFAWFQWISRNESTTNVPPPIPEGPFTFVVIDPGHGGQDSGAMCGNVLEKDLTLDVTLPGIKYNTGPNDYFLMKQMQLARFDGKGWARFGEVIGK